MKEIAQEKIESKKKTLEGMEFEILSLISNKKVNYNKTPFNRLKNLEYIC